MTRQGAEAAARQYEEIFPDRFYLEAQANDLPEQAKVNEALLELAPRWGLPLVATNDCHYLKPEDSRAHDVLLCIQTGKTVNASGRMKFHTDQLYFKTPEDMARIFPAELLARSLEIADRCNVSLDLGTYHFPVYPEATGESMEEQLNRKAREGLTRRLAQGQPSRPEPDYWPRLDYELKCLAQMGFAGYFLVVSDIIAYARKKHIPVGPGRGSAAGSLVAYSLGITDLDPLAYGLIFERFLNPERLSPPDIDMDFCYERRNEVIHYVAKTYGWENVAQITTFGSMKSRQVIRDVGRALEVPYAEVDRIAKLVPEQLKMTIAKALEQEPRLREARDTSPTVADILTVAKTLEGLPRHASTHAAGLVIADRPIVEYLPLYKGSKGELVTQFDMKGVERVGLVKFDFLGLRTLTVIDQAVRFVRQNHDKNFDIHTILLNDPETFALLQVANTGGVFQLESDGMRALMVRLKPTTFEDIIALVALYRPGPMESGMIDDYVRRKHGEEPVTFFLPQLQGILQETYGIILYQEQVMQIAAEVSGFSLAEADILRRAMGKKIAEVMGAQRERFVTGALDLGTPKDKADSLFTLIEKFAGYGFNKSHSAAYALVAYQTAYLKAHYPLEFLAALLNSEITQTTSLAKHIMDAREQGLALLPPDINLSHRDFAVEDGRVRYGMAGVKNAGAGAIQELVETRKTGRFETFSDFLERVNLSRVNRKVIEALIQAGAFDGLEGNRARLSGRAGHWPGTGPAGQKPAGLEANVHVRGPGRVRHRRLAARDPGMGGVGKAGSGKGGPGGVPERPPPGRLPAHPEKLGEVYHRRPPRHPRRRERGPGGGGLGRQGKGGQKGRPGGYPHRRGPHRLRGSAGVWRPAGKNGAVAQPAQPAPVAQGGRGPGRAWHQDRGPGGGAPGNLPAPLAVPPGPAPQGQHPHQGAAPGPAAGPGPPRRHRACLSSLPEPAGKRHPGPPRDPGPHPLRRIDRGSEPPLRLPCIEPVRPQFCRRGRGLKTLPLTFSPPQALASRRPRPLLCHQKHK